MLYAILTYCHCMCHNDPLSYILILERGMWGVSESFELPKVGRFKLSKTGKCNTFLSSFIILLSWP